MRGIKAARRASVALAVAAVAALALAPAADAGKKKKAKAKPVDITNAANAAVPDRGAGATDPVGTLDSTIAVGKKFKGLRVRDVNVTVQTTGSGATAAGQLFAQLTAPNGATTLLFSNLLTQSIGPLTLDDETPASLFPGTPCAFPKWLCAPFAGTARPGLFQANTTLSVMDNGPVKGTWTLTLFDLGNTETSVLNSWRLQVATGRPYKTK